MIELVPVLVPVGTPEPTPAPPVVKRKIGVGFVHPEVVTFAHRRQRTGGTTYRTLEVALRRRDVSEPVTLELLERRVWGAPAGSVRNGTVRRALHRANLTLQALGCNVRLALDARVIRVVV